MQIITSTIDFMLRCIEGSLEISRSSCTQIIDFIADSIHVVPKPLQWVGFHRMHLLGFRLHFHHYPSRLVRIGQ
jgi:hypothetical protein